MLIMWVVIVINQNLVFIVKRCIIRLFATTKRISELKLQLMNNSSANYRSSRPEVFLRKGVLKICSKFTEEHLCWSETLIKLQNNLIDITLRHGCPPVNLLHIFKIPFPQNTSEGLLFKLYIQVFLLFFYQLLRLF